MKHDDLCYLAGTLRAPHSHQLLCVPILCWLCCWESPVWNCCPSGDIYIPVCWEEVIKREGTTSPCMAAGSFIMLFSLSDGRGVPALLCGLYVPHPSQLAAPVGLHWESLNVKEVLYQTWNKHLKDCFHISLFRFPAIFSQHNPEHAKNFSSQSPYAWKWQSTILPFSCSTQ